MAAATNEELSPSHSERLRLETRPICNADSLQTALLTVARFHWDTLTVVGFCGAASREATSKTRGIAYAGFLAAVNIRPACFLCRGNLLRGSDIRLRNSHAILGAGNLTLVTLG